MRGTPLLMLFFLGFVASQEDCQFHKKCHDCIQNSNCMWCSKFKEEGPDERHYHCAKIDDPHTLEICAEGSLENPKNGKTVIVDQSLTDSARKSKSEGDRIVQLRPQRLELNLRKGVTQRVDVTYRQAYGYPIDLYYLMDLSNSMKDDKQQLAKLGGLLTSTLQNLTEFYTIGFGSFVDKVLMPFVDTHPDKIDKPCDGCKKAYAFRNDLPLGRDGSLFETKVTEAQISGNLDSPEGGFDALMQVIVCKDQIRWRDQARRLIVYSTDAQFHQAGDGKLAGVVVPNDERCHLNSEGEYDAYDRFDYPSIGQINKVTKARDIYVIFAVSNYEGLYSSLTDVIENSSWGKLSRNSDNVVDLVRDQYNEITSKVSLTDNSSDAISIEYFSSCKNTTFMKTSECINMREGDMVVFSLDVKLNRCPTDRDHEIVEVKTLQDSVFLKIEFKCSCDCQNQDDPYTPASTCNNQGALVCGVCSCFDPYRGETCLCTADGVGDDEQDQEFCRASKNDTELCSGRGYCVCGICDCLDEDFTGSFCHCNSRKCNSNQGVSCSGHGTCDCEKCSCDSGYTGDTCECQTDDACRVSAHDKICSGHGHCDCGECVCDTSLAETYSGRYCEDCLSCKAGKCSEFYDGVLCKYHDQTSSECNITVTFTESLEEEIGQGGRKCSIIDQEDDCMVIFTYRYIAEERKYIIYVQNEKECPTPAPIIGIIIGILAGIVFIGLLTLIIWKILTTMHDKREYAKFQKESANAQWNREENPLYKEPKNTYKNPLCMSELQTKE